MRSLGACVAWFALTVSLRSEAGAAVEEQGRTAPRMFYGFEAAPGLGSEDANVYYPETDREFSQGDGLVGLRGAVFWQWALTQSFWLGPRLGVTGVGNPSSSSIDLTALGTLRWSRDAQVGPRFVFGGGPSLSFRPAGISVQATAFPRT